MHTIDPAEPYPSRIEVRKQRPSPAMADEIPQALKQADINLYKTATRAAQLSNVKPIVAYWCMSSISRCLAVAP